MAESSSAITPKKDSDIQLGKLRHRFFKKLRKEVLMWGGETIDLAWTYYPNQRETDNQDQESSPHSKVEGSSDLAEISATPRLVVDRVHIPHLRCPTFDFIDSVKRDWWPGRAIVRPDKEREEVQAIIGFYGRYLGASGYALVIELSPAHASDFSLNPTLWRVDARPEGVEITFPQDEGEVYSQLGAYLDLQVGWAWLARESMKAKALITAEVEPGYLIGVRPGDPLSEEHPSEREDPEIEEVFSRFDAERFDTLEFLNSEESEEYPFQSERYRSWLPSDLVEEFVEKRYEAFVLSQSRRFFEAVEEVAERRKVEVSFEDSDEPPLLIFKRGPVSLKRDFTLPYLWTVHSGRQHHEGAVEYFRDDVERLFIASELFFNVKRILEQAHGEGSLYIGIEDEDILVIREASGQRRIWVNLPLSLWVSEGLFDGKGGAQKFLQLLGWSDHPPQWSRPTHSLDHCPICDQQARLSKVIRPSVVEAGQEKGQQTIGTLIKDQLPKRLWGYYSLTCPQHQVPVFWSKRETLHQAFEHQTHQVLDVTSALKVEREGVPLELLWGDEIAGALLSESNREILRERGALFAHAVTPDLLVLSLLPITHSTLQSLEPKFDQMIAQFGPDRPWRLDWSVELR